MRETVPIFRSYRSRYFEVKCQDVCNGFPNGSGKKSIYMYTYIHTHTHTQRHTQSSEAKCSNKI